MSTSLSISVKACVAFAFSFLAICDLLAEEQTSTDILQQAEAHSMSLTLLEEEKALDWFDFPCDDTRRIVIVDEQGNKIREERLHEDQSFCTSTLVPMIYKCSFVAEACGVHYYLLRKN